MCTGACIGARCGGTHTFQRVCVCVCGSEWVDVHGSELAFVTFCFVGLEPAGRGAAWKCQISADSLGSTNVRGADQYGYYWPGLTQGD